LFLRILFLRREASKPNSGRLNGNDKQLIKGSGVSEVEFCSSAEKQSKQTLDGSTAKTNKLMTNNHGLESKQNPGRLTALTNTLKNV
jgi:hypothetical protein